MKFSNLQKNNILFQKIEKENLIWWDSLKNDNEIIIEIRKDNYIDFYYNGGAIIKELKYSEKSKKFSGQIHFEYIPLTSDSLYVPYNIEENNIDFNRKKISPLKLNQFSKDDLKKIKKRIRHFNSKNSEKGIQYKFIQNDPFYIDSEFEYPFNDSTIRIDLVRIDTTLKKIVFIEVKTIGNKRLYNDEITEQLTKYHTFIVKYKKQLLEYYKMIFQIKKNLDLLPKGLKNLENIDNYDILEKPLLLFGDCEQEWIDNNSSMLDDKIKTVSIGAYYFGKPKPASSIKNKTFKNRHIFSIG